MLSSTVPKDFDIDRSRYDVGTFQGRFWHFWDMANPLNCL